MASIFPRKNKDGSITWRFMIRRKGLKNFITCFSTYNEAKEFEKTYEKKYCLDPDSFSFDHLNRKRLNEFSRKENK